MRKLRLGKSTVAGAIVAAALAAFTTAGPAEAQWRGGGTVWRPPMGGAFRGAPAFRPPMATAPAFRPAPPGLRPAVMPVRPAVAAPMWRAGWGGGPGYYRGGGWRGGYWGHRPFYGGYNRPAFYGGYYRPRFYGGYGGYYRPAYYGGYYPYYHRRYYRRHFDGGAVAAGLIGGLALGALATAPYYYGAGYGYYSTCWIERRRTWVPGWGWSFRRVRVCSY